jgi:hypothetical protein
MHFHSFIHSFLGASATMTACDAVERGAADECEPLRGRRPRTLTLTRSLVVSVVAACGCALAVATAVNTHLARHPRGGGPWPALPQHCDGVNYGAEVAVTDAMRSKLAGSTFVSGFWRLRKSHHSSWDYATRLRNTACQFGSQGVNVVFVQDSPQMCETVVGWYDYGRNSTNKLQMLGLARRYCHVEPLTEIPVAATQCRGRAAPEGIWLNKVPVFGEVVAKVESGEITSEMKSSRYFWLDGDIDIVSTVVGEVLRRYFEGASNGGKGVEGEGKFWTTCYNVAQQAPQCAWMGHEVIANMFGGSASSIAEYTAGYTAYVNLHVPTQANRGDPLQRRCACPHEEHVMTGMAGDPAFSHLYGPNSCARFRT